MRMWNVNPALMCRNHLLGEHKEIHMFIGALKKRKNLQGFYEKNLLNPLLINLRHEMLVSEMEKRGYKHESPAEEMADFLDGDTVIFLYEKRMDYDYLQKRDLEDLKCRCEECREKIERS